MKTRVEKRLRRRAVKMDCRLLSRRNKGFKKLGRIMADAKPAVVPKSPTRQVTGPYFTKMKPELSTCITAYKVTVLVCREHTPVTEEHIGNVCKSKEGWWLANQVTGYGL